jgi:hypothetical protein
MHFVRLVIGCDQSQKPQQSNETIAMHRRQQHDQKLESVELQVCVLKLLSARKGFDEARC